jgi:hypothetical protein
MYTIFRPNIIIWIRSIIFDLIYVTVIYTCPHRVLDHTFRSQSWNPMQRRRKCFDEGLRLAEAKFLVSLYKFIRGGPRVV